MAYLKIHVDRRRAAALDAASLEYGARFEGNVRGVEQDADAAAADVHDPRFEGGEPLGIGDAMQGRNGGQGGTRFVAPLLRDNDFRKPEPDCMLSRERGALGGGGREFDMPAAEFRNEAHARMGKPRRVEGFAGGGCDDDVVPLRIDEKQLRAEWQIIAAEDGGG